jgi:segregation and condensation protein A
MITTINEPDHTQDGLVLNLDHPIKLAVFEGPLDLLLFLIRKNELDIYDIPIESVTRQYLAVLKTMEKLNLEVAGEFFVMAATLMYIKSRMLLPKNEQVVATEEEEEDIDPRWSLVQQLIEYKKIKDAAHGIEDLIASRQDLLPREVIEKTVDPSEKPLLKTDRIHIWNLFNLVLRQLAERMVQGEIHDEQVTVADRMEHLLGLLGQRKSFSLFSLFGDGKIHFATLVATFLAILELTRLKKMTIKQDANFCDILCEAREEIA